MMTANASARAFVTLWALLLCVVSFACGRGDPVGSEVLDGIDNWNPIEARPSPNGEIVAVYGWPRGVGMSLDGIITTHRPPRRIGPATMDVSGFDWMPGGASLLVGYEDPGSSAGVTSWGIFGLDGVLMRDVHTDIALYEISGVRVESGGDTAVVSARNTSGLSRRGSADLWSIDLTDGVVVRVTDTVGLDETDPGFSHDGAIVFLERRPIGDGQLDNGRVMLIDSAGNRRPVSPPGIVVQSVDVDFRRNRIIYDGYSREDPDEGGIWVVAVGESGEGERIANFHGVRPRLCPDGRSMLVTFISSPGLAGRVERLPIG